MTTICYRDNLLAADQAITNFEGNDASSREFVCKISLHEVSRTSRMAIATSGDTVDGVMVERAIAASMKEALAQQEQPNLDLFGWPEWDCWNSGLAQKNLTDPKGVCRGVILYRDLENEKGIHAWSFFDHRVIKRVPKGQFVAVGCDALPANAAMEMGADAILAVWVACKYGAYSSGPVNFINAATMILNTQRVNPLERP